MIGKLIALALVVLVAAPLFSFHQLTTDGASALVAIAGDGLTVVDTRGLFCELLL